MIVARVRLDRLRDPIPLYSALWRLGIAWWSDPFEEAPRGLARGAAPLEPKARSRQLIVADDGAGGWISLMPGGGDLAVEIAGGPARDIAASELKSPPGPRGTIGCRKRRPRARGASAPSTRASSPRARSAARCSTRSAPRRPAMSERERAHVERAAGDRGGARRGRARRARRGAPRPGPGAQPRRRRGAHPQEFRSDRGALGTGRRSRTGSRWCWCKAAGSSGPT